MNPSTFYSLLLTLLPGVGASRYWQWLDQQGSVDKVLLAAPETLPGISPEAASQLRNFQQQGEMSNLACRGYRILEALEKSQAHIITTHHNSYPPLLKQIHRPPPVLFCRGNDTLLNLPQLAVVGTRNPTAQGTANTRAFVSNLAQGGFTITSGLATGIDATAHDAALSVRGKTIAVMGTGIDICYPKRHQSLADAIVANEGLLVTEFAPGTAAHASHFPQRNRIISGLSVGVLVMEAAVKSGSLITARYALEQNREVFAIPGSIHNPQSRGCHALIKQGAQLVETTDDIFQALSGMLQSFTSHGKSTTQQQAQTIPLDEQERRVIEQLGYETVDMELLLQRTGLSSAELSATLLNLEIKGVIRHSDWGYEAVHEAV